MCPANVNMRLALLVASLAVSAIAYEDGCSLGADGFCTTAVAQAADGGNQLLQVAWKDNTFKSLGEPEAEKAEAEAEDAEAVEAGTEEAKEAETEEVDPEEADLEKAVAKEEKAEE
eukprot:gnl/TRDRNA2_/TRDRNA2_57007_c0_seq1.p1 gnl/TRDRNA2_/TRDRNA2_57007_c0~~gnl/TRDRNA2_/TRDRNA2_57007_c0_seq1.p1  ORF type:complete len:116 (+),score=44.36 gnl/TRDRNA2_/TRDRNA2_57007_c0_seq1:72-419(+)